MQRLATTIAIIGAALIALAAAAAAQSPAPPQNQSIAETQWTGRPSSSDSPDLEGGAWTLYFRSDGVLVYSAGGASYDNAHWRQRDALVFFEINDHASVHVGFLRGDALEGVAYSSNGQQRPWTLRRQPSGAAQVCPANMVALRGAAASLVCICPPNISLATVWGDASAYTDDSHICTAAVHAGVITAQAGGTISVKPQPGRESYPASTANGVTTLDYGSWQASYTISAPSAGK
jgi:hypothetical protein